MINPLHHQRSDGEIGVAVVIPVPVVAVETTLVPVQIEPVAVRVAGCVIDIPKHHPSNALWVESNAVPWHTNI